MDDLIKKINELPDDVAHDEANLVDYEGDPFGMLKVSELKALTLHLSETQKKLDSAREALQDIADDGEIGVDPRHDWDAANDANRHVQIARKWLDAEQGEGE
jgi:hypothetical protein